MRINDEGFGRTTGFGGPYSNVDDVREDCKTKTHYAYVHINEEDAKNIAEREIEASTCEVDQ